jgi:hypothetical protein
MSNAKQQAYPQNTVYLAADGQTMQAGPQGGMTKLEYFAGLAMQGIIARQWYNADGMAADAVVCARALLAELEKEVRA